MPKCAGCKESFATEQALSDHLRKSTPCKGKIMTRARTKLEQPVTPATVHKTLVEVKQVMKSRQQEPVPPDFFDKLQKLVTEKIKLMAAQYPNQPRVLAVLQGNSAMIIFLAQAEKLKTLPDIEDVYQLRDRIIAEHGSDPINAERIAINMITEQINAFVQTPKTERLKRQREKPSPKDMEKVQERITHFWEARLRMITMDTKKEAERMKKEKTLSPAALRKMQEDNEENRLFYTWAKQLGFIAQVSTTAFWAMMVKPLEGIMAYLATTQAGLGAAGFANIPGVTSSYFSQYVVQAILSVFSTPLQGLLVILEKFIGFLLTLGPYGAFFGGFTAFFLTFFLTSVLFRFVHGAKTFKLTIAGVPIVGHLLAVEVGR